MAESLLFTTARVTTFDGPRLLTGATGFFFARSERLFLVTSRHVLHDGASGHRPNRIEVEFHVDPVDLRHTATVSIWLFKNGMSQWRQGVDSAGDVDVGVMEIDRSSLPPSAQICCFTSAHLQSELGDIEVGTGLLVVGFPLGFHDTTHRLPVVRHAVIASAFGIRFQGQGYFLTDARTHRGTSGAPVVMRDPASRDPLPWKLLGVHSSRIDIGTRDRQQDESLGLNAAWYAAIVLTLTT
nr:trypsin-like peptidase domain-containing protein [Variovorax boronicumulans]